MTKNISASYKLQLLDSLKTLYAERIEYFPKYRQTSLNNFGLDMINYMADSPFELWNILRDLAGELKLKLRHAIVLKYLALTAELYQSGKITVNDVQAAYDFGNIYSRESTDQKNKKDLTLFLDRLYPYIGGDGKAHNALQPTVSQSDLETILSQIAEGKYVEAYGKCQEIMTMNPAMAGYMYVYMGAIWAELPCQGNEIEKRAKYWVAVDFLKKAKSASYVGDSFDKLIKRYQANFPDAAEAFMYDLTPGQSYTVSCCGLRAVTTVQTK
jgi:hypothetical protein